MEQLVKIVGNTDIDIEQRLKAAKQLDGMSDSIIHAYIIMQRGDKDDRTKSKMIDQLNRLADK